MADTLPTPLVSIELLKIRLLIGEDGFYEVDNLKQALLGSEQLIGSRLKTNLRKKTISEVFYVEKSNRVLDGENVQIQTRHGFIKEVTVTKHRKAISADALAVEGILIDQEKGVITIPFVEDQMFYTVTYTSGFEPTDELPEWLTNLILLGTEIVYNLPSNGKEARGSSSSAVQIDSLVIEHSRLANRAVRSFSYAEN